MQKRRVTYRDRRQAGDRQVGHVIGGFLGVDLVASSVQLPWKLPGAINVLVVSPSLLESLLYIPTVLRISNSFIWPVRLYRIWPHFPLSFTWLLTLCSSIRTFSILPPMSFSTTPSSPLHVLFPSAWDSPHSQLPPSSSHHLPSLVLSLDQLPFIL